MTAIKLNQFFVAARIALLFILKAYTFHAVREFFLSNGIGLNKQLNRILFNNLKIFFGLVFLKKY